jgi:hypothetical protein
VISTPEEDATYTAAYRPSEAVHRRLLRQHDVLRGPPC